MKILHSADWHLGELNGPVVDSQNARLVDTVRCLDFLVEKAEQEQPDAILIAGDLLNKSQMWASPMLNLIDIAASRLRRLAAVAPTVLMFGTATHDSIDAFNNINSMQIIDLHVVITPRFFPLHTKSGPLQVAAIPGLDKGHFRALNPGMDPTEENAICSKLLGDIVLGLSTLVDSSIPSVLMAHYTTAGCEYDNGQVSIFNNSEVILPREALAASPFDLVCLGHIHKAQEVLNCGRPVFYSGPLNGLTFNEEGQPKGFLIHEIDAVESDRTPFPPYYIGSEFIKTPSREFVTQNMNDYDVEHFIKNGTTGWYEPDAEGVPYYRPVKDAIVRVHYTCTDELNKQLNRKALEMALHDVGAFYVAEIKPVQITTALSKQEMTENAGPLENLAQWLKGEGYGVREINALVELARPLVEMVSAKMPSGKLSGVFVPKRIEVRNYRSYREESFDFSPITFATVNGSNGVGKSALFMDALCDCLYEEPREGELTGWINNDVNVKSGAITFEFAMGETDWQVIRTRTKSGKTTLALQELVDGKWVDRGAEKKDDTQAKITALLGMDAMTFRCCGLIMQDAYGLFLEADKPDRMEVLGNILGLGIYEQLTELAKAKVTEVNRGLTIAKEKLAGLNEKLKTVPGLELDLAATNKEIGLVTEEIAAKEKELTETEGLIQALKAKAEKVADLQRQINTTIQDAGSLITEKAEQQGKIATAKQKLDAEEQILQKAAEYEQVKKQVTVLQAKRPRLIDLNIEENRLTEEIERAGKQIIRLVPQIREAEQVLENRAELEKAVADYLANTASLENMELLQGKWNRLNIKCIEADRLVGDWDKLNEYTLDRLNERLKELREQSAILEKVPCADGDLAGDCQLLKAATEARADIPRLEKEIEKANETKNPHVDGWQDLIRERDSLTYDSGEHKRLKDLASELRPKAEKAAGLEAKAQLLENLQGQKKQLEEQKAGHEERLQQVKVDSDALAKELEPLAGMEARLPKLELWLKAKEELPACRAIVKAATDRIAAIDRELDTKESVKVKLEQEKAKLQEDATELPVLGTAKGIITNEVHELRSELGQLNEKAGGLKAKLDALAKDTEERKRVADEMEPTAKLLVEYQTLSKAFSLDGVPFSIVRSVVPELSAMANDILADMTGGKMSLEIKLDKVQKSNKKEVNALEIWINDYQRGSLPYKSRSGGQKVKAALSVAFALADLKARRAGIQLGMMFVDEPPFLDSEGTDAYCDALMTMSQRYANMLVVAISHDPRMKARFPQIIDVVDAGEEGSKVRLVA